MGIPTSSYRHAYHQSLVYKMFLASKPGTVHMTFADALAIIRKMHALTLGMKQIVYLVGWQFDGHDSKYLAWSEVNHRLKREQDATARDSLVWLMREAASFNAVVSLHINMDDAYTNSPLWDDYVNNDLLIRHEDGSLVKGGVWDGEQSYLVSKKREWESGFPHTLIAYSRRGCTRSWPLPTSWSEHGRVTVSGLGWSEQRMPCEVTYQDRALALDLAPDQAVSITLQP